MTIDTTAASTPPTTTTQTSTNPRLLALPPRQDMSTVAEIEGALGFRFLSVLEPSKYHMFETPEAGWTLKMDGDNPYRYVLRDTTGKIRATVFYKESMHTGSVQLAE